MVTDSVTVPAAYVAMTSFPVPRVIGGSAASTKDYPWVVKLVGTNCSGALIAPKKVLTAGHCAQKRLSRDGTRVPVRVVGSSL